MTSTAGTPLQRCEVFGLSGRSISLHCVASLQPNFRFQTVRIGQQCVGRASTASSATITRWLLGDAVAGR